MKKLFSILMALSFFSCKEESEADFQVEGTVKNIEAKTIYLEETTTDGNPVIVDSASVNKNGEFTLASNTKKETLYSLRLDAQHFPFVSLINDSKKITVTADFNKAEDFYTVSGSKASTELKDFLQRLSSGIKESNTVSEELFKLKSAKTPDSLLLPKVAQLDQSTSSLKNYVAGVIGNSSSPSLSLYALGIYQNISNNPQYTMQSFTETEIIDLLEKATKKFPDHIPLTEVKNRYKPVPAPDFSLPDVNGQPVALSSFKGKYVLVDFWASWCRPCREENPNVVKAHRQFSDKNFTILGVSLDQEKEAWVKAIQKDSLAWSHVSDLKFWESSVVPLYGISGIPYNVLLDPKGMIIAKNLRGENLQSTLRQVLK
jgi:peroxiredoxin